MNLKAEKRGKKIVASTLVLTVLAFFAILGNFLLGSIITTLVVIILVDYKKKKILRPINGVLALILGLLLILAGFGGYDFGILGLFSIVLGVSYVIQAISFLVSIDEAYSEKCKSVPTERFNSKGLICLSPFIYIILLLLFGAINRIHPIAFIHTDAFVIFLAISFLLVNLFNIVFCIITLKKATQVLPILSLIFSALVLLGYLLMLPVFVSSYL